VTKKRNFPLQSGELKHQKRSASLVEGKEDRKDPYAGVKSQKGKKWEVGAGFFWGGVQEPRRSTKLQGNLEGNHAN